MIFPWRAMGAATLGWLRKVTVRKLLGLVFAIMGLARLGLFSYGGGGEFLKPTVYGLLLIGVSLALLLTHATRLRTAGRLAASCGVGLCWGMAADLVLHGGSTTSAANLLLFSWALLGEAGSSHDLD
jgi:hypothetical protein